jgi:hypothetical protein
MHPHKNCTTFFRKIILKANIIIRISCEDNHAYIHLDLIPIMKGLGTIRATLLLLLITLGAEGLSRKHSIVKHLERSVVPPQNSRHHDPADAFSPLSVRGGVILRRKITAPTPPAWKPKLIKFGLWLVPFSVYLLSWNVAEQLQGTVALALRYPQSAKLPALWKQLAVNGRQLHFLSKHVRLSMIASGLYQLSSFLTFPATDLLSAVPSSTSAPAPAAVLRTSSQKWAALVATLSSLAATNMLYLGMVYGLWIVPRSSNTMVRIVLFPLLLVAVPLIPWLLGMAMGMGRGEYSVGEAREVFFFWDGTYRRDDSPTTMKLNMPRNKKRRRPLLAEAQQRMMKRILLPSRLVTYGSFLTGIQLMAVVVQYGPKMLRTLILRTVSTGGGCPYGAVMNTVLLSMGSRGTSNDGGGLLFLGVLVFSGLFLGCQILSTVWGWTIVQSYHDQDTGGAVQFSTLY